MRATLRTANALLILVAILAVSGAASAAVWPASRDVQQLSRQPLSSRLDQSVFSQWTVLWNGELSLPVLAYGQPLPMYGRSPEQILELVTLSAGSRADFSAPQVRHVGPLTRCYFPELHSGLPVLGGRADLVLDRGGNLSRWSLRAHDWPESGAFSIDLNTASQLLAGSIGHSNWNVESDLSFAAWFPDYDSQTLRPVYWVRIAGSAPHKRWEGIVDAAGGQIILNWSGIHSDTVQGTVRGQYWPMYDVSPVQIAPFGFERVVVNANPVVTDTGGVFSIETGATSTVSTTLEGPWVDVYNEDGARGQLDTTLNAPYTPLQWLWTTDHATPAELNLFYHVNLIHEWYKVLDPAYNALDYSMHAEANYGWRYDNAFWNGWGIYFGDGQQYRNFAMFSDIIYHEYTHGVTDGIYPNGMLPYIDQSGALNEAWSDYIGCSINGDPYEGDYIGGMPGGYFRNLLSQMVYPRDWRGEVHEDSPFISAPLWTLRTELGIAMADSLAHFARYGLAETFLDYLIAVLETDDNDNNLTNGTPHGALIYSAFGSHGIGPGDQPHFVVNNVAYRADGSGSSVGDGDRFVEQGETVELRFDLTNDAPLYPPPARNVQLTVSCDDPYTTIQNGSQGIDTLAAGSTFHPAPILLAAAAGAPEHWTVVHIQITANGGAASFEQTIEYSVGTPRTLIVQDDPVTNVEKWVPAALRSLDKIFDVVNLAEGEELADSLMPRPGLVIWLSGNATGTVLATNDQYRLQKLPVCRQSRRAVGSASGRRFRGRPVRPERAPDRHYARHIDQPLDFIYRRGIRAE